MADSIDTRVSMELHADNVTSIEGYSDSVAHYLGPTREAFDSAYKFIAGIHNVREAAMADPTLTPAAALLKADDFARQKLPGVTKAFDGTIANLDKGIASLERELASPVKAQASQMVSGEIRAHMKASADRMGLMQKALNEGDDEVLSAVLGAPPMLSGFTKELHAQLLIMHHSKREPQKAAQLQVMHGAKNLLDARGGLVLKEMAKAVGVVTDPKTKRQITPHELRQQRAASHAVYAAHA